MIINGHKHRLLPDTHDTGYGWGYGGRGALYSVCLVDCFDPPMYLVGADTVEEALEAAEECLSPTLDDQTIAWAEEEDWLTFSPSGRPISTDDDIRITLVRRYDGLNRE